MSGKRHPSAADGWTAYANRVKAEDTPARAPFLVQCDGYRFRAISALVTAALLYADEHLAADEAGQRAATERFLATVWDYKAGRLGE